MKKSIEDLFRLFLTTDDVGVKEEFLTGLKRLGKDIFPKPKLNITKFVETLNKNKNIEKQRLLYIGTGIVANYYGDVVEHGTIRFEHSLETLSYKIEISESFYGNVSIHIIEENDFANSRSISDHIESLEAFEHDFYIEKVTDMILNFHNYLRNPNQGTYSDYDSGDSL